MISVEYRMTDEVANETAYDWTINKMTGCPTYKEIVKGERGGKVSQYLAKTHKTKYTKLMMLERMLIEAGIAYTVRHEPKRDEKYMDMESYRDDEGIWQEREVEATRTIPACVIIEGRREQ